MLSGAKVLSDLQATTPLRDPPRWPGRRDLNPACGAQLVRRIRRLYLRRFCEPLPRTLRGVIGQSDVAIISPTCVGATAKGQCHAGFGPVAVDRTIGDHWHPHARPWPGTPSNLFAIACRSQAPCRKSDLRSQHTGVALNHHIGIYILIFSRCAKLTSKYH